MWKTIGSAALAVLLCASASALGVGDVTIGNSQVATEVSLVEIYDAIFGTNYVGMGWDSNDLYQAVGIDPFEYNGPAVSHFFGERPLRLEARYANFSHTLGYYDPVLNDPIANMNPLFSVAGGWVTPGSGGPSALLVPAVEPYGFYLEVAQTGETLYSEYDRNANGDAHMLLLVAPAQFDPTGMTFLMAWEDRAYDDPDVDWDYNDFVVLVSVVPEPSSIVLMGLGIAGLVASRIRKLV